PRVVCPAPSLGDGVESLDACASIPSGCSLSSKRVSPPRRDAGTRARALVRRDEPGERYVSARPGHPVAGLSTTHTASKAVRWTAVVAPLLVSAVFGYLALRDVRWAATWR